MKTKYLSVDFEDGTIGDLSTIIDGNLSSYTISTTNSRVGKRSLHVHVGDSTGRSANHMTLMNSAIVAADPTIGARLGDDTWYAQSFFMDAGFPLASSLADWWQFTQWYDNTNPNHGNGISPYLYYYATTGRHHIAANINAGTATGTGATSRAQDGIAGSLTYGVYPGYWVDFLAHFRWGIAAAAYTEWWMRMPDYDGLTWHQVYFENGLGNMEFRDVTAPAYGYRIGAYQALDNERTSYHDCYRIAATRAEAEAVWTLKPRQRKRIA